MQVVDDPNEIQDCIERVRISGKSIGFVPTMGALHIAHESLMQKAVSENDFNVVSIFVNPTQFGPGEDYDSYPRTYDEDIKLCEKNGIDIVFYPEVQKIYYKDQSISIRIAGLTDTMCGKSRPGHFEGVAMVVAKLFNLVRAHKAYFGQKDFQQFKVIERMVRDLNFNIKLVMCPTVREYDGLAVSSRNRYLNSSERQNASAIYAALREAETIIKNGERNAETINKKINEAMQNNIPDCRIDYAAVYDAVNLSEVDFVKNDVVVAAAVWIGSARLIDNILVKCEV